MSKDKLLIDDDFNAGWKNLVFKEEDILWQGKPKKKFSFYFLEQDFYHDVMTGPSSKFIILLVFFGVLFYAFYEAGNYLGMLLTAFFFVFVFSLPDIILRYYRNNTKYAATKDVVLFQTLSWFQSKTIAIPFMDIAKISFQEFKDGTGVITFLLRNDHDIITRNFTTGDRRIYPTFEDVESPVALCKSLQGIHYKRIKGQVFKKSNKNKTKKNYAKQIQILIGVILIAFTIYAFDFYVFPKNQVEDIIVKMEFIDFGVVYKTEKKYRFIAESSFLGRDNDNNITIHKSPIFKTVIDVFYKNKSNKNILSSSLHGMIKYFHFAAIMTLYISWILLTKEKIRSNNDLVMKITVISIFMTLLPFYIVYILF